jgi:cell wall-associated NlpC family hydrolase
VTDELAQRQAVIAEAMTWLRTPFMDNASIKGAGVDCAHFVHECYRGAGIIDDLNIEQYSPQHFLHRDEERFMSYVLRVSHEIGIADIKPADLILYKFGRVFSHGAIAINWPDEIIHSHKEASGVVLSRAFDGNLSGRDFRAFSFWKT